MNWLAHIFLSEYNIEFQIANYLADPLKGKIWDNSSIHIKKGMQTHKMIDSYTDTHILFNRSKQRLGEKGLLKAVVIDLTYDYLLTKNWDMFSNIPIDRFLNDFYQNSYGILPSLPPQAAEPLKKIIEFDLLNKYQNLKQLNEGFIRVDKRLSPRLRQRDKVSNYYERVCLNIDKIEEDFLEFFPNLINEVEKNLDKRFIIHWK